MHVRIAWEIYNHQQKAKADSKNGLPAQPSKHLASSGLDILSKSQRPPGQDYLGKRPGPPQDLLSGAPTLYGAGGGGLAPSSYDLMSRSHYAAASPSFYGPGAIGKFSVLY